MKEKKNIFRNWKLWCFLVPIEDMCSEAGGMMIDDEMKQYFNRSRRLPLSICEDMVLQRLWCHI